MRPCPPLPLGAALSGGRATFCVWAPRAETVELVLDGLRQESRRMDRCDEYFTATVDGVEPGQRYGYRLDGGSLLADPASRAQPDGVHGLSAVHQVGADWTVRDWPGLPLDEYVLYELHVGTFTPEGTLDAAAGRLAALRELGITVVELMPLAPFPGTRNWGYDGVHPFAVHHAYGGPAALQRFVDACHAAGMGVCLDVVYNHVGPEGNQLARFGPYFTGRYGTPWGEALNFDGPGSDHVREYFIASALQWIDDYRIDALRLDAIHAIADNSAYPFLRELADRVHERARVLGRHVVLIAESDLGDPRVVRPPEHGGIGMDAQWLDDFHHALHAVLTGESDGYYQDFGSLQQLARAYGHGFVYAGEYSTYRRRRHGAPADDVAPARFVVFLQNHDQVGNRMQGDRLTQHIPQAQLELAAAAVLLGPFTPLLFMGEAYAETAPFPYFVSHTDASLIEAVRSGRAREFTSFGWAGDPPDPQAECTFESAVLDWRRRTCHAHGEMLSMYTELLRVRREISSLRPKSFDGIETYIEPATRTLRVTCSTAAGASALYLHFDDAPATASVPDGEWSIRLDTAARRAGHAGAKLCVDPARPAAGRSLRLAPHSAVLLLRVERSA